MDPLSFSELREANVRRLPLFKDRQGMRVHDDDGGDWTLTDWFTALAGEVGEAGNLIKKLRRGDFGLGGEALIMRTDLADELADIAVYLDILAFRCGVDLGSAIRQKFNEVSTRVACNVYLGPV